MPTVARWWSDRTDPERIELYTRWSFYGWLAMAPLLAVGVHGSAEQPPDRPAAMVFLVGSVAVALTAVLLARAGLAARRTGRSLPRGPALAAAAVALLTSAAGVLAYGGDVPGGPALVWGAGMPPAMVLTATAAVWPTRTLTRAGFGTGGAIGIVVVALGAPLAVGAVQAVVTGAALTFLALAFRFSVWVLDVVREMERTRGVQAQLAVAEERLRFARDLHDVMGRNLSAIAVKSQLAGELVRRGRDGAAEEVAGISRIAEESLREVREVVRGYRATDLAGELAGARSVLRSAGVACTVEGEAVVGRLGEPAQVVLGWVVREAVTNVLRHSRAGRCTIALTDEGEQVVLTVTNDAAGTPGPWGTGLTGLGERLAAAGGRLTTRPAAGAFTLVAAVPA
ncbi:sensor histidine kinase [Geodermatophilus sp. SYSU D00758]